MTTDLDRLWAVKTGELQGRAVGKTFAACHDVAGTIGVDGSRYIVLILAYERDITWILPMLEEVLAEYHLPLQKGNDRMVYHSGGKILKFISSQTIKNNDAVLAGLGDYNMISFVDYGPDAEPTPVA